MAHGGVAGAAIEALVGLAVLALFLAVWLRERRVRDDLPPTGPAMLRDDDEPPP